MGVVYRARQISIDRVVALKMLNQQIAEDPTWVQRFYNEAKACSRLQHPNTIRMFDFGQTSDGRLFMTMEFLEGMVLRQAIAHGPMPPHRVIKILIQCCASLGEAHSIGIIHRDIKPDNVFLLNMAGSPDFVKLLDFSVAKLLQENDRMKTQAGVVFGTPQYMSPEQGRGLPLDARSDLYALGILAYEMLTGRVPFSDENPMNVLHMHLRAEVPPMPQTIPYNVQNVVRRALEKDPARRYQSAGEMMQHCQQVFAELGGGPMGGPMAGPAPAMAPGQGMMPPGGQGGGGPPPLAAPPQKTMYAPQPPGPAAGMGGGGQGPGPAPMGPMGQGGYQSAPPQQKTLYAGAAPGVDRGAGPVPGPPVGPGGYQSASPQQKTMFAQHGSAMPGMQGGPVIPGNPIGPTGPTLRPPPASVVGPPPAQGDGAPRTMMLQNSEGIVSIASKGGKSAAVPPAVATGGGASALFWIVSLLTGAGLGVAAWYLATHL